MLESAIELARRAGCAAVVTDSKGDIAFWNDAATELLGKDWRQVVGEGFPEAVDGHDVFGNRLSRDAHRFEAMVERGESLHRYAFDVSVGGACVRLAVSVVVVVGEEPSDECLVYELEPLRRRRKTDLVAGVDADRRFTPDEQGMAGLTPRQAEVLGCLARDETMAEISRQLGISPHTTRNHIQNILERLNVHSRAAAVALAIRHGLI